MDFLAIAIQTRRRARSAAGLGRQSPGCPWRSPGSCWAMTRDASYPELIFMESSSHWSQPEKLRKAWQGVCCHFCLGPTQIKQLHKIHGDNWSAQNHRNVSSTDMLELWAAVIKGHQCQGTGLETTGKVQRWEDFLCGQWPRNLSSLLLTPLMEQWTLMFNSPVQPCWSHQLSYHPPPEKPGLQAFCRDYCSQCCQKLKPCTGCSADMRET